MVTRAELDRILPHVSRPARYVGNEWNRIRKEWDSTEVRVVLAYPDTYEVGMSNLGISILYDLVNRCECALAERVYAPWPDMRQALKDAGLPLYSLESYRPLSQFDVIGFGLQYELNYTNVLSMLELAGIPLLASERADGCPLIVAGGSCTFNPEPVADFFDAFVLGDGEEVIVEIVDTVREWKCLALPRSRERLLSSLSGIAGVYVPSFFDVDHNEDGTVRRTTPHTPQLSSQIAKRTLAQLPAPPVHPIVPYARSIHDRAMVEIQRGCTQGCRFCQAGMIYRPTRERTSGEILEAVEKILASTGYEEIALLSLSTTDHREIEGIVSALVSRPDPLPLSIALPSLRVDAFSVDLANMIRRTRKTGLTFAPEAGSQRLRNVINKKVTEEDLLRTAEAAYSQGWTRIKLYFMIGLPTETSDDIEQIAAMVRSVLRIGMRHQPKRAQVNVSVATFVPKPHTPYQWYPLEARPTIREKQQRLRALLRSPRIHLSWSDHNTTILEATLTRGDRRLGRVILRAWRKGAEFDAWTEHFNFAVWEEAFSAENLEMAFYASRLRGQDEVFPWEHLNCGVDRGFLWKEWQRSLRGELTPDCRDQCNVCGMSPDLDMDEAAKIRTASQCSSARIGQLG